MMENLINNLLSFKFKSKQEILETETSNFTRKYSTETDRNIGIKMMDSLL